MRSKTLPVVFLLVIGAAALAGRAPAGADHSSDSATLSPGANLVVYEGISVPAADVAASIGDGLLAIWSWNQDLQSWRGWSPLLPPSLQGFEQVEHGGAYFVMMTAEAVWTFAATPVPLPATPPNVQLLVGEERIDATPGSFCWPAEGANTNLCADVFVPLFQSYHNLPDDLVQLSWDAPTPTTLTLELRNTDLSATPVQTELDAPGAETLWAPTAEPGEYVLRLFAEWSGLGPEGTGSGDAAYFFPVRLGPETLEPVLSLAPIQSVVIEPGNALGQYIAIVTFGQPDSCHMFDHLELTQDGFFVQISIWHSVRPPSPDLPCKEISSFTQVMIDLGTNFSLGIEYIVTVNDAETSFIAQ